MAPPGSRRLRALHCSAAWASPPGWRRRLRGSPLCRRCMRSLRLCVCLARPARQLSLVPSNSLSGCVREHCCRSRQESGGGGLGEDPLLGRSMQGTGGDGGTPQKGALMCTIAPLPFRAQAAILVQDGKGTRSGGRGGRGGGRPGAPRPAVRAGTAALPTQPSLLPAHLAEAVEDPKPHVQHLCAVVLPADAILLKVQARRRQLAARHPAPRRRCQLCCLPRAWWLHAAGWGSLLACQLPVGRPFSGAGAQRARRVGDPGPAEDASSRRGPGACRTTAWHPAVELALSTVQNHVRLCSGWWDSGQGQVSGVLAAVGGGRCALRKRDTKLSCHSNGGGGSSAPSR